MSKDYIFTSESVTEGHPDKICDQISDTIVDRFLQRDALAYVDAECALSQNTAFIAVQYSSPAIIDMAEIAREVICQAGYDANPFNGRDCTVHTSIRELPLEETLRRDERSLDDDTLDQITVRHQVNSFGYACRQTSAYMPATIWLAHKLARRLTSARFTKAVPFLAPDGKTQVGIQYRDGKPHRIHSISLQISCNHLAEIPLEKDLRELIMSQVITPTFSQEYLVPDAKTRISINWNDPLVSGGPMAHSGLSGRKTAIDTYGEFARHSGSALSGKSPIRIDRIGTYMARYAAKHIVVAGIADECELHLSYSPGLSMPESIRIETFGTGRMADVAIEDLIRRHFDFRPASIMKNFKLRQMPKLLKGGFYRKLAAYGQVGRMDIGLPWEVTDRVEDIRKDLGLT